MRRIVRTTYRVKKAGRSLREPSISREYMNSSRYSLPRRQCLILSGLTLSSLRPSYRYISSHLSTASHFITSSQANQHLQCHDVSTTRPSQHRPNISPPPIALAMPTAISARPSPAAQPSSIRPARPLPGQHGSLGTLCSSPPSPQNAQSIIFDQQGIDRTPGLPPTTHTKAGLTI